MNNNLLPRLRRIVANAGCTTVKNLNEGSSLKHLNIVDKKLPILVLDIDDAFGVSVPKKTFTDWETFGDIHKWLKKNVNVGKIPIAK